MEVDNDSDDDDIEEEEDVVDEEDLSILEKLCLAGGTNDDGPLEDDIFHDDTGYSDDENAPVDLRDDSDYDPDDPNPFYLYASQLAPPIYFIVAFMSFALFSCH